MSELFSYPEFDAEGEKILTNAGDAENDMMMTIRVYKMQPGSERTFCYDTEEMAILLVQGEITFEWNGEKRSGKRDNFIEQGPYCLHTSRKTEVKITANAESEIIVQRTENDNDFGAIFYRPEDCSDDTFGKGVWESRMQRTVRTVFDYNNAPYSNMVNGEVINHQGSWSSYTPHHHPQPEVYYYRFERPEGFGGCFLGDHAFKTADGSCAAIKPGLTHPQVTAPGFNMYYCWMIRHLPDKPWKNDRNEDPRFSWISSAT